MNVFARRIADDLRGWSRELLDPGIAPAVGGSTHVGGGQVALRLASARVLLSLIPSLLDEAEEIENPATDAIHATPSPVRARLSRRPVDYVRHEERLLPRRWQRVVPVTEPARPPLAWLLFIVEVVSSDVEAAIRRHDRLAEEAARVRGGGYWWAESDRPALAARRQKLSTVLARLRRGAAQIRTMTPGCLRPTDRVPQPYPISRSWLSLRRQAENILDPWRHPHRGIDRLLDAPPETADLPFLYQRWCGMRLIEAFARHGFSAAGDVIGSVFVGGRITLTRPDCKLHLWVEPRLLAEKRHESGLTCVVGHESTPDFLIVTPGPDRFDAFILDATLATDDDLLIDKGRYLETLGSHDLARVADTVGGPRPPLRSWAIAPLSCPHCRILGAADRTGRRGVIPAQPLRFDPAPLAAWVTDVVRHAAAWRPHAPPMDD